MLWAISLFIIDIAQKPFPNYSQRVDWLYIVVTILTIHTVLHRAWVHKTDHAEFIRYTTMGRLELQRRKRKRKETEADTSAELPAEMSATPRPRVAALDRREQSVSIKCQLRHGMGCDIITPYVLTGGKGLKMLRALIGIDQATATT